MNDINSRIGEISRQEQEARQSLNKIKDEHRDIFTQVDALENTLNRLAEEKNAIKQELISGQDFDLHKVDVDGKEVKVAVSKIVKVGVEDIDAVPGEFKSMKMVVDEKKAQEYIKVMGEVPAGLSDKSYYRLTWKDEDEEKNYDGFKQF